jgi:thioredoxin reductase
MASGCGADLFMWDVVIVGGGPAGLNGGVMLGRSRRRVLLCDAARPRNARSRGVNGFLTREGTSPAEMRRLGREELRRYPTVTLRDVEVATARRAGENFEISLATGEEMLARKLLLAPGLMEDAPAIEGARELYGRGVFNCPYCDGWELRDQPFAVYGGGRGGEIVGFVEELLVWSRDLVLCTDGPAGLADEDRRRLEARGVAIIEENILRLEGGDAGLERIVLASGRGLERRALFFTLPECRQSPLIEQLGIDQTQRGAVATGHCERTNVPGLYVAGDASRRVHFAVVAAAEGAMAGFAINAELVEEGIEPIRA